MIVYMYFYFTNVFLLNSLNARTDHDVQLNKFRHKKSMTSNKYQAASFKWDTVQDAVLLQIENFAKSAQIGLNVFLSS